MKQPARSALRLLLLFVAATYAISQDLATVAPQVVKIVYEDGRVRVVRLHVAPHESVPTHDRPARVVIPLTTSDVSMPRADGRVATVRSAAGEAGWGSPTRRSFTNLDAPLDNIIVDLKNATEPASGVPQSPSAALPDGHHHWRFENQYVRVYDLRIPPGATTGTYEYAPETVVVVVSNGGSIRRKQGSGWKAASGLAAGDVEVITRDKPMRPQQLQNRGPNEFHAVVVQLLR